MSSLHLVRASVPTPKVTLRHRLLDFVGRGPFLLMHLACLGVFFVPVTWTALAMCVAFYVIRMFGITAGYHRYFSHRAYKTSRIFQFILGFIGASALQKGPLWWASHHRHHHRHSDSELDPHSPVANSVWWSHVGWVLSRKYHAYDADSIKDFMKYPELRLLNFFHVVPGILLAVLCYWLDGASGLFWGFFVSTVLLYHGTFLVNSVCHIFGKKRYVTGDESRNNAVVAILTLGEGWHNNHHCYQSSANQGFFWWEVDLSYYTLKTLSAFGIVWGLRKPPLAKLPLLGQAKSDATPAAVSEPVVEAATEVVPQEVVKS
ncbi:acyl-CoA desaturase [Tuwongella immobilis]|uniref:Fatty acid desaturase domain-containing protein n=1 Tax=Tuwongella immobilis TaxID=692036 RepID=A0A6C2YLD2_9BACT|nr:acyl-CoA desaturase [Tuwongella immobilis]VIP02380.1 delta 9 acyl-lipid fatty acid desaturase : Fatty acid desaturase OS=Myxococcus stipitatus (strain DSM 14675 / JCM 12634 / Mx s8) GN=MYSTI_06926 PE=4 SV=1: FA_desaturase [Tuwongella immobilis]VTS01226.1 delta 9 acyl-lipid fatty acid desaturase : Fatty acid desaturase OS=Myxococcus stipitatus (strain DSM 14675 / JCM 12634 / Mx s8) GN=MYSTI_06926 PE=4 SV=1: FA_desaturase [Tuwongella immobilis]